MIAQTHSAVAAATTRANLAPEGELVRALRWLGLPGTAKHLDYHPHRRRDIETDFVERYKLRTAECLTCDGRGDVETCVDVWRGEHQTEDGWDTCDDCGGSGHVRCEFCGEEALLRSTSAGSEDMCLACAADVAAGCVAGDIVPLVRS